MTDVQALACRRAGHFTVPNGRPEHLTPVIRTLLITHRGEIACRIVRTAQRMGIATVIQSPVTGAPRSLSVAPPRPLSGRCDAFAFALSAALG